MEIKGIVYSMEITEFAIMASAADISGMYMPAVTIPDTSREDVILQIHKMFQKQMLVRESGNDHAILAEPYAGFFEIIRKSDSCLALRAAGDRVPGCCLYGSDRILSIKSHYTGREKLTMQMLAADELAEYLIESGFCPEDITDRVGNRAARGDEKMDVPENTMDIGVQQAEDAWKWQSDDAPEQDKPAADGDRRELLQIGTEEFVKQEGIRMTADRINCRTKEITGRFYIGTDSTGLYLECVGTETDMRCPYSHAALARVVRGMLNDTRR